MLIEQICHPDDRKVFADVVNGRDHLGEVITVRWVRRQGSMMPNNGQPDGDAGDGDIIWSEQINVPVYDEGGTLVAIEGIARDVTARKQMENDLQATQAWLNRGIKAANVGLWEWDVVTDEFTWSVHLPALLGLDAARYEDNVPRISRFTEYLRLVHPDDIAELQSAINAGLESGDFVVEHRIIHPDDSERWMECRGEVEYGAAGQPRRIQGSLLDITGRKQAEIALRQRRRELETLLAVAQQVSGQLDLDILLEQIVQAVVSALPAAEAASLWLYDSKNDDLVPRTWVAHDPKVMTELRLPVRGSLVGQVFLSGQPVLVDEVSEVQAFTKLPVSALPNIRSVLGVPLQVAGASIGALFADGCRPAAFTESDMKLLVSLAAPAAIGIENARLFNQVSRYAINLEQQVAERTARLEHLAQELSAESEERQAILDALGEAVTVVDEHFRVKYVNPAYEQLTGESPAQSVGRQWLHRLTNYLSRDQMDDLLASIGRGQVWRGEYTMTRSNHETYDAALTVAPIFRSRQPSESAGYVAVKRDITPMKDTERIKDQIVSNVSHELRNPLAVITLVSGNLVRYYDRLSDSERRGMLQDLRQQTLGLNEIVNDILELSRLNGGRRNGHRAPLDLVALYHEAIEEQRVLAEERQQSLRASARGPLWVFGDSGQLRQIVRNLLNNAIKYSPVGSSIGFEVRNIDQDGKPIDDWPESEGLPTAHCVAFRVIDNGIGIEQEDLSHIFDPFFRGRNVGTTGGTGLGLAITKALVESHLGKIAVASQPGNRTIFAVYLPRWEGEKQS